jgi:hypothetical protein
MPKSSPIKSEVQVRAAIRASEQRRLDHACIVIEELIKKHIDMAKGGERDVYELMVLKTRLDHAIKNQHIKDAAYQAYNTERLNKGDF